MQYTVVRGKDIVEQGDVLSSVNLVRFLDSLKNRVEVGDLVKTEKWVVMYTDHGTWRSVAKDETRFWDMGLNMSTITALRRRGVTFRMIVHTTERDFTKLYGRRVAKDVAEGLAVIGRAFKGGPPTTIRS